MVVSPFIPSRMSPCSRSLTVNDRVNETGAAHCPLVPIHMPVEQGGSVSCRLVLVGLLAL
jgi:hypothetical protein